MDRYEKLESVGSGASATAYLVREKTTKQLLIMKWIDTTDMTAAEKKAAQKEAILHQGMNHPNIVLLTESFSIPHAICIVMERCHSSLDVFLSHRLEGTGPFSPNEAGKPLPIQLLLEWVTEMLCAVAFIHQKGILHRDIKPSNVFITSTNHLKLGDFGVSKGPLGDAAGRASVATKSAMLESVQLVGTPYYLAPEICNGDHCTKASDIWSLGVLFYEMCALHVPFQGNNILAIVAQVTTQDPPPLKGIHSRLDRMIASMLHKDPLMRPTALELIQQYLIVPVTHPSHPDQPPKIGRLMQRHYRLRLDGSTEAVSSSEQQDEEGAEKPLPLSSSTEPSDGATPSAATPQLGSVHSLATVSSSSSSSRSASPSSSSSSDAENDDRPAAAASSSLLAAKAVPPLKKVGQKRVVAAAHHPSSSSSSAPRSSKSPVGINRRPSPAPNNNNNNNKAAAPIPHHHQPPSSLLRGTAASQAKVNSQHPVPYTPARSPTPTQSVSPSEHEAALKKRIKEAKSRININEIRSKMMQQRLNATTPGSDSVLANSQTTNSEGVPVMIFSPLGPVQVDDPNRVGLPPQRADREPEEEEEEELYDHAEEADLIRRRTPNHTAIRSSPHHVDPSSPPDHRGGEEEVHPHTTGGVPSLAAAMRHWYEHYRSHATAEDFDEAAVLLNRYQMELLGRY